MIVADTSAVVALIDADDRHHETLRALWESDPDAWLLPWVILPGVDYLVRRNLGDGPARLFLRDVCEGRFTIEYGEPADVKRAAALVEGYAGLGLGLVDGVIAGVAERLRARAIATRDLRHFGALNWARPPLLYPRDL